jgi:hypothetical protein
VDDDRATKPDLCDARRQHLRRPRPRGAPREVRQARERASSVCVARLLLATWDDHDYGTNDGGADFPAKAEAKRAFLEFFADPPDSPRRAREGVYDARVFGPEGKRVR